MPSLLVRLTVDDFVRWKGAFDASGDTRRANGSSGGTVFRGAADPNEVLALLDWDDLERARLFVQSDDIDEALGATSAAERPTFWFLNDAGRFDE